MSLTLSWTQPSCHGCWSLRHPGREPLSLVMPSPEQCVFCGRRTQDGIYVRIDPATAPHPTQRKGDR